MKAGMRHPGSEREAAESAHAKEADIRGGCLCGAVRYRLACEPIHATMCHCSDCRRACGAPSVAWVTVPAGCFSFTQGAPARHASSPPVERTFCGACGTPLTYQSQDRTGEIDITSGSLDDPETYPPRMDYYCRDKLSWVQYSTGTHKE